MVLSSYGSIRDDNDVINNINTETDKEQSDRDNSKYKFTSFIQINSDESNHTCCSISSCLARYQYCIGVTLALVGGILFTVNNFIINQWQVSVSDVVLVRCVLTITIYTFTSLLR